MVTREQLTMERINALLEIISNDGYSPSGEIPANYAQAINNISELQERDEIEEAHRNGNPPPQ